MHETFVTVMGNVASQPRTALTKNGHSVTSFRMASTPRRYDRARGSWVDGATSWFTVTCWRALADHVASSIGVGHPVMVHGRQEIKDYTRGDGSTGTSVEIEATSVGHDLTRGTTMFARGEQKTSSAEQSRDTTAEDLARLVAEDSFEDVAPEGEREVLVEVSAGGEARAA